MPALETEADARPQRIPASSPRLRSKRLRRCLHLLHGKDSGSARRVTDANQDSSNNNDNSTHHSKRRTVAHDAVSAGGASGTTASGDSSFSSTGVDEEELDSSAECSLALESPTTPIMRALSDTEVMGGDAVGRVGDSDIPRRRSTNSVDSSRSSSECSRYSTKRKGVKYSRDGAVVCCRFCDILRARDEDFLYEDELITVFRPLAPVVESHILVVPRRHIRNVNMLTTDHLELLGRMKVVAAMVLQQMPPASDSQTQGPQASAPTLYTSTRSSSSSSISSSGADGSANLLDADYKFAFHTPPFNSIDHVHMHAFRRNEGSFGCFGSIKYCTETWWCRSFEQVISRLAVSAEKRRRRAQAPRRRRLGNCMASDVCVSS